MTAPPICAAGAAIESEPIAFAGEESLTPLTNIAIPSPGAELPALETELPDHDPDLWLYRDRTVGMLRRYLRLSIEVGRLPSLLGREFFRTRVTSYTVSTFEDAVIFVHDVERILERLDAFEKKLIAKVVFQDYSQEEAARLLNCGVRTVARRFPETVDRLSEIFLDGGLLTRLPTTSSDTPESCQGVETAQKDVTD
jgi:hypothetical protein